MSSGVKEIIGDYTDFLDKVFTKLEEDAIDVSNYELDHICYRVETNERYENVKEIFLKESKLLEEGIISGRMISTFQLNKPLIHKNRKIYVIEVPAPKFNNKYAEGLEHVEFVIDKSFKEFKNMYPEVVFKINGENKEINPETQIVYDNCSVKFHHYSLEYVITHLE